MSASCSRLLFITSSTEKNHNYLGQCVESSKSLSTDLFWWKRQLLSISINSPTSGTLYWQETGEAGFQILPTSEPLQKNISAHFKRTPTSHLRPLDKDVIDEERGGGRGGRGGHVKTSSQHCTWFLIHNDSD